jgi:hypothetical protein
MMRIMGSEEKAEGRKQKAESRRQKAVRSSGGRRQEAGGRRQELHTVRDLYPEAVHCFLLSALCFLSPPHPLG